MAIYDGVGASGVVGGAIHPFRIHRSPCFKFVRWSLILMLTIMFVAAIIVIIVVESGGGRDRRTIGVVALVGAVIFVVGLIGAIKEHMPLVLSFALATIIYLIINMYSRLLNTSGAIIFRTVLLLLVAVEGFILAFLIRDVQRAEFREMLKQMYSRTAIVHGYGHQYQTVPTAVNNANFYTPELRPVQYSMPGGVLDAYQTTTVPLDDLYRQEVYLEVPQPITNRV